MPPLLTNSKASCRSEKLTGIVPPQEYWSTTWKGCPMPVAPPEHRRHCRHDDRRKTFWAGCKIATREGQTQEALRVEQENTYRIRRDLACLPRNRRFEFISLHRRVSGEPDFLSRARNPCLMAVRPTLSAA